MTSVLAIDPGGQTTALVVRKGRTCEAVELVKRGDSLPGYLGAVTDAVLTLDFEHHPDVIAVEDLVPPNPHIKRRRDAEDGEELNLTNIQPLLDTAYVIGALLLTYPDAVLVRPAGHGKTPDLPRGRVLDAWMAEAYPPELLGRREIGGAYTGELRHARSAWSIAGAAELQTRQQRLEVPSP